MTRQSRASSIALLIACVFGSAWAASKSQPHPHQGILTVSAFVIHNITNLCRVAILYVFKPYV